ncbi:MAG: peptidylprolyl isomerase [Rhizobiales bacterium 63-7]|nr:SurA N-terminal domain-containing protein [Hyphomicrobiales bacterium]OJU66563.1 MAG: peptidylprolyl isomerase [Rhizobiales bacterium 63-7]
MLETLRVAAKTWVAKGLLLLLVASFAIWGVSRTIMHDMSNSVITVGDQNVTAGEFRLAYQRQVANISRQFGTQLTPDQARAFGIDQQVFAQLVAGAALDQLSQDMHLGLSEDRLAQLIAEDPAFHAVNGQFDRQLFTTRLRNANLNENDYIKERSKVAVRAQIVDAVSDGFTPPATLVDALKHYRNESRGIDYLLLSSANIDPVKAPTDEVLTAWFDTVKSRYRAPEYRKFTYVKLEPADIANPAGITDDEIKADFEKRKDSYKTPETRTVEQLTFPNKEMADGAANALRNGTTFDQLVTDQGKTSADVLLGDFSKDAMVDQKVAEAAFAVKAAGGTTPVVEGAFGPVIVRITNIRPETTKTLDEVKEEIRKDLAVANASSEILNVHDRFEDARANGASLADAAKEQKLNLVTVAAVDASGNDQQGNPVKDIPGAGALLTEVFKSDVGAETTPVSLGNDGYAWFEVQDIIAEHDRPLAEVKDKVVADWTAEQQKQALAARAAALKDEVAKGKPLEEVATALGLAVEKKAGLRRNTDDPVLGRGAVAAAFGGPLGTVANAVSADGDGQVLLKVTEVNEQPTTDVLDRNDDQVTQIAKTAGDDILDQMVSELQTAYGVSINRALADQAMNVR